METWIFRIGGIGGLLALAPLYFLEPQISLLDPPAITHPEYFYGLIGVALAWQPLFLIIASDPRRYRPVMPAAFIEKIAFAGTGLALYLGGRLSFAGFAFSQLDWVLLVLFVVAYIRTGRSRQREW